jgi:hypothetical protein
MKIFRLYYPEERIKLPKEDAWVIDRKNNIFAPPDGFEEYLKEKSFRVTLRSMDKKKIESVMVRLKSAHKGSGEFVSERTIIAILLD